MDLYEDSTAYLYEKVVKELMAYAWNAFNLPDDQDHAYWDITIRKPTCVIQDEVFGQYKRIIPCDTGHCCIQYYQAYQHKGEFQQRYSVYYGSEYYPYSVDPNCDSLGAECKDVCGLGYPNTPGQAELPFYTSGWPYFEGKINDNSDNQSESVTKKYGFNNLESNSLESVYVSPNPAKENALITIKNLDSKNVDIRIYNSLGEFIYSASLNNFSGNSIFELNTESFASGIYFVKAIAGDKVLTASFVIAK